MNKYTTTFKAKCPNAIDGEVEYTLTIESQKMIYVEDINKATIIMSPGFHENIADYLYGQLGGRQTITACHQGVKITTTRSGFDDEKRLAEVIKSAFTRHGFSDWRAIARQVSEELK